MPSKHTSAAVVSKRAALRLRDGHVWVYRSDVTREPKAAAGAVVAVEDDRGHPLGTALYSSSSQIALRLISQTAVAPGKDVGKLITQRLDAALAYRQHVVANSEAWRVVFSEADSLPGLIIDRYNDIVSFQVLTQAFDQPSLRDVVLPWMKEKLAPRVIVERVDARIRELEKLEPRESGVAYSANEPAPTSTVFTMNGLKFHYDAIAGQKTGAFLDQRENYAAAERWAHGEALDVFCYQGGFALHIARKCARVTAVDSSRPALEVAEQNEQLNAASRKGTEIDWTEGNAFDLMKDYAATGKQYDTIVLDPPAFAKSKSALETALRGYKELNLRALRMLRPGGVLVTCSCSYHVAEPGFLAMLASASADVHRPVRVLERRGAAADHPSVLTIPETSYLKCVICTV